MASTHALPSFLEDELVREINKRDHFSGVNRFNPGFPGRRKFHCGSFFFFLPSRGKRRRSRVGCGVLTPLQLFLTVENMRMIIFSSSLTGKTIEPCHFGREKERERERERESKKLTDIDWWSREIVRRECSQDFFPSLLLVSQAFDASAAIEWREVEKYAKMLEKVTRFGLFNECDHAPKIKPLRRRNWIRIHHFYEAFPTHRRR